MKIVVIGGNGQVGSRLVPHLAAAGHEVSVASRAQGVDAVTGAGLDAAPAGAREHGRPRPPRDRP
ncbi:MAG TPA: NAD-dependent epimerase/dehydratase family protein [Baekduia sp.]|uniref:NAD-dependent epimerase/dehydratase family protein n=1 Tax=Baekduia sp. TaxID=2600305 RepID=UPI002D767FF6|nr:NAD-dependent epimerase/dehydratase family protein [Baekduia sp.]HET6506914.1 NAD-dependent epimerase/dehydratase family protein [Baekduia sp.]